MRGPQQRLNWPINLGLQGCMRYFKPLISSTRGGDGRGLLQAGLELEIVGQPDGRCVAKVRYCPTAWRV